MIYYDRYNVPCHELINVFDMTDGRHELATPYDTLQVSIIKTSTFKEVEPHWHRDLSKPPMFPQAQEMWLVMAGSARVKLFDFVGKELAEVDMTFGDILVTMRGGHSLLTSKLLLIECKNGPYENTKTLFNNVS